METKSQYSNDNIIDIEVKSNFTSDSDENKSIDSKSNKSPSGSYVSTNVNNINGVDLKRQVLFEEFWNWNNQFKSDFGILFQHISISDIFTKRTIDSAYEKLIAYHKQKYNERKTFDLKRKTLIKNISSTQSKINTIESKQKTKEEEINLSTTKPKDIIKLKQDLENNLNEMNKLKIDLDEFSKEENKISNNIKKIDEDLLKTEQKSKLIELFNWYCKTQPKYHNREWKEKKSNSNYSEHKCNYNGKNPELCCKECKGKMGTHIESLIHCYLSTCKIDERDNSNNHYFLTYLFKFNELSKKVIEFLKKQYQETKITLLPDNFQIDGKPIDLWLVYSEVSNQICFEIYRNFLLEKRPKEHNKSLEVKSAKDKMKEGVIF